MKFTAKCAVSDLFPSFAILNPMGISDSDAVPFSHSLSFICDRPGNSALLTQNARCVAWSGRPQRVWHAGMGQSKTVIHGTQDFISFIHSYLHRRDLGGSNPSMQKVCCWLQVRPVSIVKQYLNLVHQTRPWFMMFHDDGELMEIVILWNDWIFEEFEAGKHHQRKFRSLTSDNMDSWKKQSREAESEDQKQRREVESEERNCAKVSRKKIHTCEMLGKLRIAVFFQWFVGRLGRKVGSLKRRVRS